jgi:hypothetical protein
MLQAGCIAPGNPNYRVTIPVSNVFWDPLIVERTPNVIATVPGIGILFFTEMESLKEGEKALDAYGRKVIFPI